MSMNLESVVANLVEQLERRFFGKYRGLVVDNADPEKLGRLKLRVPSVLGEVVTGWAMPCVPYGGDADQGFLFVPELGAGVWVEFEEGDLEFPVWVGTFWSKPAGESELPKPNDDAGAEQRSVSDPPTRKILKTRKGHTLQFEDKDGEEMVTIVEATHGHVVTLNRDGVKITDASANAVTLNQDGVKITDASANAVTLTQGGVKITDAAANAVTLTQDGVKITDAAANAVTLTQDGVKITDAAANAIEMKGDAFAIIAKVPFTIDASGQPVTIVGDTIDLNKG